MTFHLSAGTSPARIATLQFDLIIAGAGAAGASSAIAAARRGLRVAVVAKGSSTETNTSWARGGVAAVCSGDDSFEQHISDTMQCGGALCDPEVVRAVVEGGPAAIERLVSFGASFDRLSGGDLSLGREGGHTRHRIVHASGDATGPTVQEALRSGMEGDDRITVFPGSFALDVIADEHGHAAGLLARLEGGQVVAIEAPDVVLATGGAGQIFRETTNPVLATGDGLAMGLRAGAVARDLEFFQFHPTCLYIAGAARVLISEIVRGGGGILRDAAGDRFMPEAHPDAELAPRDVVTRAINARMAARNETCVYLDLSEVEGDPHDRYPGISRTCRAFGIDIARDPVPVRPGAHYMIGGLRTDLDGRSSLPGLWAIGECASSGLHGANRMGSNSLLEGLVIGDRCGRAVGSPPPGASRRPTTPVSTSPHARLNLTDLTYSMKSLMWRMVGVERTGAHLAAAETQLAFWSDVTERLAPPMREAWELRNMLLIARAITAAAITRQESRGAHWRLDFPQTDTTARHTLLRFDDAGGPRVELGTQHELIT